MSIFIVFTTLPYSTIISKDMLEDVLEFSFFINVVFFHILINTKFKHVTSILPYLMFSV